jgi:hypothetical protein
MSKKLTVLLPNELDEQFRNAVFKTYGLHKGGITLAVEEALKNWIKEGVK